MKTASNSFHVRRGYLKARNALIGKESGAFRHKRPISLALFQFRPHFEFGQPRTWIGASVDQSRMGYRQPE
jgi:hypothetical protein